MPSFKLSSYNSYLNVLIILLLTETVVQLFHSLKKVVSHESTTYKQGSDIWDFLKDLYLGYRHPGLHEHLCLLTFDIFEQFHLWVQSSNVPPDEYRRRVETCAVGLTRVFAVMDMRDMLRLRLTPFFIKLERLVQHLNNRNSDLQDQSAILRGLNKRRWPDLLRKIFPMQSSEEMNPATPVVKSSSHKEVAFSQPFGLPGQ